MDFFFYKHLEIIKGSDLPDSPDLKNQLESLTEEVIELLQENRKQQNSLNRVQKTLNNVRDFI